MKIGALLAGESAKKFDHFLAEFAEASDVVLIPVTNEESTKHLIEATRNFEGLRYHVFAQEMTDWLEELTSDAKAITITEDAVGVLLETLGAQDFAAIEWVDNDGEDIPEGLQRILLAGWDSEFTIIDAGSEDFPEVEFEDHTDEPTHDEVIDFEDRIVQRAVAEVMKRLEGDRRTRRPRR